MVSLSNKNILKFNKRTLMMIVFSSVTVISLVIILIINSLIYIENYAEELLIYDAEHYNCDINDEFEEMFDLLYNTSNMIALQDDIKSPEVLEALNKITKSKGFDRMAVTTTDGISYTNDNYIHNSSDREYFINGMKGISSVTEIDKSVINDLPFIAFSCPIYKDDTVVGVLRVTVTKDYFKKMLSNHNEIRTKEVFLIDSKGSVILINDDNYFETIIKGSNKNDSIANDFEKAITNRQEKFIQYSSGKTVIYAYSIPFKYNDWSLVVTDTRSNLIKSISYYHFYNVWASVAYTFLLIFILFSFRYYYKKNKELIKLMKKENNIINDIPTINIFSYDIQNKVITVSNGLQELIGCKEFIENAPESLFNSDFVLSDDKEKIVEFFDKIKSGSKYIESQFKIKKYDGRYENYKVYSTTLFEKNTPVKAIGYLEIIDVKNGINDDYKVHNDSLTGLYNKLATKNLINEYINNNPDEKCAFIIIDIFNFNKINEKYGYSFGDNVIINFAAKLKMLFRSSDILGRSDDDEFILFLKNVKTHEFLEDKIQLILNSIKNVMPDEKSLSIMINIGVSMYPQNASDFNDLYENAETALFKAKKKGAGQYELFTDVEL